MKKKEKKASGFHGKTREKLDSFYRHLHTVQPPHLIFGCHLSCRDQKSRDRPVSMYGKLGTSFISRWKCPSAMKTLPSNESPFYSTTSFWLLSVVFARTTSKSKIKQRKTRMQYRHEEQSSSLKRLESVHVSAAEFLFSISLCCSVCILDIQTKRFETTKTYCFDVGNKMNSTLQKH